MRATAYHEAGHVVVGVVLGLVCVRATMAGEYGQTAFVASPSRSTWAALRGQILVLMAGGEAERECCPLGCGGDLDDLLEIRRMVGEAELLELEPRLRRETRKLVRRHRDAIERVAAALLERGTLTADAIESAVLRAQ